MENNQPSEKKEQWNFDKNYLIETIKKGKEKLKSSNLSRRTRQSIRIDIERFERFILNDYELENLNSYKKTLPKNIDKLKEYILQIMARQYKMLGKELIHWIMNLSEQQIFKEDLYSHWESTELEAEEQVEITFKNYEKNSPKFLAQAKNIILDNSIRQIQLTDTSSSYCHHDSITGKSFIIIDQTESPCIFNHEIEHAIESAFKYHTHTLYIELGPILHEMLFNDELYKLKGTLKNEDFGFRIEDSAYILKSIYNYLQILLLFAKKNFDIPTNEFLITFQNIEEVTEDLLEEYLREEIATNEKIEDMSYLFSFLKAIELREKILSPKNNQFEILEHYLKNKKFNFNPTQDNFKIYERYNEEMEQKTRKRTK